MAGEFKSIAEQLRAQGIDAKRTKDGLAVSVFDIWDAPEGDPMWHPRSGDALDAALLYDIAKNGVRTPVLLARMGLVGKKMRLALSYGMQRTNHLREAVRRMQNGDAFRVFVDGVATGEQEVIPWVDGKHYIPVLLHPNNDVKSLLLERAKEDAQPYKRQHSPSVIAMSIAQLRAVHATDGEIMAAHMNPARGIDKPVLVALERWGELSKEVRVRFDDGAPIGLLPSVVDMPREEQMAALDKYIEAGVSTKVGATRVRNREERAKGGGNGEAIRPATLKKILAVATPTEEELSAARDVLEALRDKGSRASEETISAHDTMAMFYFGLGSRFSKGDLSVIDEMPPESRAALKKAAKEAGRTGETKKRGRPAKT